MPGPSVQDSYNPTQSVSPDTAMPNDYLSVQSNPNQFGGQVGQATEKLGTAVTQGTNDYLEYKTQQMGIANEHSANQGEIQLAIQGGDIYNQYKNHEGLDASNVKDQYVSQYTQLNDKIRASLPNDAARRAYDSAATRRLSFTIQDMNSYAADQQKKGYRDGRVSSVNLALTQAGQFSVANDDHAFGEFVTGTALHDINALYTAPIYGKYQTVPVSQDKNGYLQFDTSTRDGKIAQDDYTNYVNDFKDKAWSQRIDTISTHIDTGGGTTRAWQVLKDNEKEMSPATFSKLQARLSSPYRNDQTHGIAMSMSEQAHQEYLDSQSSISSPFIPSASMKNSDGSLNIDSLTSAFHQQESGGGKTSTNLGQIQPGTWAQYAKPGENINNAADNTAVTKRILTDLSSKYNGDIGKIATAYFSGQGNVSSDSQNPWIEDKADVNGKTVSSYVSDMRAKTSDISAAPIPNQPNSPTSVGYTSEADWLRLNSERLIDEAGDRADKQFGGDATLIDAAKERTRSELSRTINTQTQATKAVQDNLMTMVINPKNPITDESVFDNSSDSRIKSEWYQLMADNPFGAQAIRSAIRLQAKGSIINGTTSYGTDFYRHFDDVLSGKVTDIKDLGPYIGSDKNRPITISGLKSMMTELDAQKTPNGSAFLHSEREFLSNLRGAYTGSGKGVTDAKGDDLWEKALMDAIPKIQAGRASGKTTQQLFSPDSPDYVGGGIQPREPGQAMKDRMTESKMIRPDVVFGTNDKSKVTYASYDALKKANLGREKAFNYLDTNKLWGTPGWPKKPAPQVPMVQ